MDGNQKKGGSFESVGRLLAIWGSGFASLVAVGVETAAVDFAADRVENALIVVDDPAAPAQRVTVGGSSALAPPPNPDYFERDGIRFRVPESFPRDAERAFVVVEHLDSNIALIEVRFDADREPAVAGVTRPAAYRAAEPLAGYTAVGTGQARRAVFALARPAFNHRQRGGGDIQIEGVRSLTRVTVSTTLDERVLAQARNEVPKRAAPHLSLKRPMQLVTTFGVDARSEPNLENAVNALTEYAPLINALGFNGIESYVKWSDVAPEKDRWDWSYYDALTDRASSYGLEWFPLLISGSAYALPKWYFDSPENIGFVCLEHGKRNNIQTIFCETHTPYAQEFIQRFGERYEPKGVLLGVRLGPSGNYGESQYPAGGNWGFKGAREHIHIGWWAGDAHAPAHFQRYLKAKYPDVAALNRVWDRSYASFDDVKPFIAQFAENKRERKDMVDWYVGAMTEWCERWAVWARQAMPQTPIYQSSGGWGFVESGTDFTDQTKSMAKINGGIRSTNETDSYVQTFYATRMLSSAARFYGVPFGAEPAGFGSARGVMARLYNVIVNNGQHLFYYHSNLLGNDQAIDRWLKYAPLLDQRADPLIEVAALYPDTMSKLDDAVFRNLYAFTFNSRAAALRPYLDFDFCSERMIIDGALPRYKALVIVWNFVVEQDALDAIDAWVRGGGTVICSDWRGAPITTVEENAEVWQRWRSGDTGLGAIVFVDDDREPPDRLARGVVNALLAMPNLDPRTRAMLNVDAPRDVYVSVLTTGTFAILNFGDAPAIVKIPGIKDAVEVEAYGMAMVAGS